jgi:hypothetical protein
MAELSYDRTGAARQALQEIYRDYGLAGVDNEALLNQLLPDLLAGSPRETSLLRAAASAGVASMLTTRINGGMAPDAAVRDVAAVLSERSAFDPNACLWVASEYATALGHPVRAGMTTGTNPVVPQGNDRPVNTDATPTTMDTGPVPTPGPAPVPAPMPQPGPYPGPHTGPFPAPQPAPFPGPAPMPMPMPYPNPTPKKSSAGLIIGIVAGAVALICVIGLVGYFVSRPTKPCTGSSCVTVHTSTHPPVDPSTSPPPQSPPTIDTLIPSDLDADNDCVSFGDSTPDKVTGVVDQLNCVESSISTVEGATVDVYLFSSVSSLHSAYAALNTDYKFHPSEAGSACPPTGNNSDGSTSWHHRDTPDTKVGTVECYSTNSDGHVYIWSNEPELTILVVDVDKDISFTVLEKWWETTGCCRTT